MKAIWQGVVIAESDDIVIVEGSHYFPFFSIKEMHFENSDTHTTCSWKGVADYLHVTVNGVTNNDAAWWYPEPKPGAEQVNGRVAFWLGIEEEVYADSAYQSKNHKKSIKEKGIRNRVLERAYRNKPLTEAQKQLN